MVHRRVIPTAAALLALSISGAPSAWAAPASRKPAAKPAAPPSPSAKVPEPQAEVSLFKEATFLLPASAKVSARWVLPPTEKTWLEVRLAVDPTGAPLLGFGERLVSPTRQWVAALPAEPSGMIYLPDGALLLAVGSDLGLLAQPLAESADEKGVPRVAFQPFTAVPLRRIEVLAAAGGDALCAGFAPQRGKYGVYQLRNARRGGPLDLELIFETGDAVTALAGDEAAVYVATGRTVTRVSRRDGAASVYYVHPSTEVKELALTPAGLVVSTGTELVLAGKTGALELMRSSGHRIAEQGGTVYAVFSTTLGVLALENLADLARFDLGVEPQAPGQGTPALTVAGLRFFEAGPPPYASEPYADRFDRSSVRRVVTRIDYTAVPAQPRQPHSITVSWYEPTGGRLWSASYPATLAPAATAGTLYAAIGGEPKQGYMPAHSRPGTMRYRLGEDPLGWRYPGRYRVEVEVDGVSAGTGSFTLAGDPRPIEVLDYDDLPALKALLAGGLDARTRIDGTPLVSLAMRYGSARAVETLLAAGADPNATDKEGSPPLAVGPMAAGGWRDKAESLVRHGAAVNAVVGAEKNPLVHALWSAEYKVFLLRKGADPRARSGITGETLLEAAVSPGLCTDELIGELLGHGVDVNQLSTSGWPKGTALGRAITFDDEACVALLLSKGASQRSASTDPQPQTALYVALEKLRTSKKAATRRIARLLVEKGGTLAPQERWIMFEGDNASLFDPAALAAGVLTDDTALERASRSSDPELQELALRAHLSRVRDETEAATSDAALRAAHDHCLAAFKLAEAHLPRYEVEIVPGRLPTPQHPEGAPALGVMLFAQSDRVYVQSTSPGSAAEQAGLQPGDLILSAGGANVKALLDVITAVSGAAPGQPVKLAFLRDDPGHLPELPLICGLLEHRLHQLEPGERSGMHPLAQMNLSRWLAGNPNAPQAPAVRALLDGK